MANNLRSVCQIFRREEQLDIFEKYCKRHVIGFIRDMTLWICILNNLQNDRMTDLS